MLKKIATEDLKPGMYLHALCGSWMDHPFWRSKFVITNSNDIHLIQKSGVSEVWIDVEKGADVAAPLPYAAASAEVVKQDLKKREKTSIPKPASMSEELQRAAKICTKSKNAVISMFNEVRMGKTVSLDQAGAVVQEISLSVMRNSGALISLARLKTVDDYTYMHSVAVCALMVALARQLNLDEAQTREAGMAGLLHDLGKALIPDEVLNKPGKLTVDEFDIMKAHPEKGHRLLMEAGFVGEIPLDVCLHHHEKIDGSGYPHGLKSEEISLFAKMGMVCDVYDAITSPRPYKAGWDPVESIQRMNEWSQANYDQRVFQAFINSVGIYPIGSLVRLSSGRLGVVVEQSTKSLLKPKVRVFFSIKAQTHISPEVIDLSHAANDNQAEKIVGHEDPKKWAFKDMDRLWTE